MASERCGAGLRCAARRCAPDRSAPPSPASARERIPGTFGSRGVPRGPKVTEADLSLKKPCSWSKEWGPPQSELGRETEGKWDAIANSQAWMLEEGADLDRMNS